MSHPGNDKVIDAKSDLLERTKAINVMAAPEVMRDVMAEADMTTPGGMVGTLLSIEHTIGQLGEIAKLWQAQADAIREELLNKMKELNLATVKHSSGVSVLRKERKSLKILNEPELMASLRKLNVLTALTEEIPKHREVKAKVFEEWYKGQGYPKEVKGIELKVTEYVSVTNPK